MSRLTRQSLDNLDFIEWNILELKQTRCIGNIAFLMGDNERFRPGDIKLADFVPPHPQVAVCAYY